MQEQHRRFSVECFNACWAVLDKSEKSPEDLENMVLLAGASLWHWKQRDDCQASNLSIGYWQVSRAHAVAGHYEMALYFGERCLEVGEIEALSPFLVGYAYEALARAEALRGDLAAARRYVDNGQAQLDLVEDAEERRMLEGDLAEVEWMIVSAS